MRAAGLDPVLVLLVRVGLALLFAHAAVHKLRRPRTFRAALAGYGVVPSRTAGVVALLLVVTESAIALSLVAAPGWAAPAVAAALLVTGYALALATTLLRGRMGIDCGCAGPGGGQPIHWGLVGRNGVLAAAAFVAAAPVGVRALTWVDGLTLALGLPAVTFAYAAADTALANVPRLAALRAGKGTGA